MEEGHLRRGVHGPRLGVHGPMQGQRLDEAIKIAEVLSMRAGHLSHVAAVCARMAVVACWHRRLEPANHDDARDNGAGDEKRGAPRD